MTNNPTIILPIKTRIHVAAEAVERCATPQTSRQRFVWNIVLGALLGYLVERQVPGPSMIATFLGL